MKTNIKTISKLLLASAISLNAHNVMATGWMPNFYVAGGLTFTELNSNLDTLRLNYSVSNQAEVDNNGFGHELSLGTKLDQYLSLEAGYVDLGSLTTVEGAAKQKLFNVDSIFVSAGFNYPVTENISLIAKAGAALWEIYDTSYNTKEEGIGLIYGAGLDVNLYDSNNRTLRLEWKHHDFDNTTLAHADTVSTSIIFRF